ncbi:ABC transporter ATP-binding protein [Pseudomonas mosselii]|uniref:ABC transporter ATP-binding protein n=1 Tax=Pseudomonas mosselii TaxID=78327 RepID=UPI0024492816|nr:ABC transporter ATP-binding protein [Pseudomonas mosselii]MDH1147173.1 ABC transporter ATP-binding protein [Pseudomonas mosselii]
MSSDAVIKAINLSKCYEVYQKPHHRLLQMFARGRSAYFQEFWAVRNVSFEIQPGETVGIIGSNGSGKSTLLQMLCGTLNPSSGSIDVKGRIAALLELGAGFNPEFTGRENVYLNAAILGLDRQQIDEQLPAIEAFAEIGEFIEQPVKTYSSGMYVRLAFSVAIHTNPSILVVDEALSVGDARFQAKCMDRIKQMKRDGVSILFVSHDVSAVRTLCDRAIWLDKGTVRGIGDVFMITGLYNEYLFSDAVAAPTALPEPDLEQPPITPPSHRPINHWGSHVGIIISAGLFDANNQQKSVFLDFEPITVRIRFRPERLDSLDGLSVSFSLKNLAGSDLIVGSTWNHAKYFEHMKAVHEVAFQFENPLQAGEYLLVAAVENRSSTSIHYYEYIEGAQYFASSFASNPFGQFMPKMAISITSDIFEQGSCTP